MTKKIQEDHKAWMLFNKITEEGNTKKILLYGKPGTSKTSKANACAGIKGCYNVTLTEESSIAEIVGMWIPQGNKFQWMDGVAIKAWKEGKLLVINEIDKASGSVLTILNSILDDKQVALLTLPSGETVSPQKGFRVIATMNGKIAELPESLLDRFDIKLEINQPCIEAISSLPEDLQALVYKAYSTDELSITFREIQSFAKHRKLLEDDAFIVFGEIADDVRSALKLGSRPKEKPVTSETTTKFSKNDLQKLIDYWENTSFEQLNERTLINMIRDVFIIESVFSKARIKEVNDAFAVKPTSFRKYERELTKMYNEICEICVVLN